MDAIVFPPEWSALGGPHVRWELLAELRELSDPAETSRWLNLDPTCPVIGFDQTLHFFFDDHEFNQAEIGQSLFDDIEVDTVLELVMAIDRVAGRGRKQISSQDALNHWAWPEVERAALRAFQHLRKRGEPKFEESKT
jgi:hypothetical protein